jgi:hypothetical protein
VWYCLHPFLSSPFPLVLLSLSDQYDLLVNFPGFSPSPYSSEIMASRKAGLVQVIPEGPPFMWALPLMLVLTHSLWIDDCSPRVLSLVILPHHSVAISHTLATWPSD